MLYTVIYSLLCVNVILSFYDWEKYKNIIFSFSIAYSIWLFLYAGLREPGSSPDDINYILNLHYSNMDFEWAFSYITDFFRFYNFDEASYFLFISFISQSVLFISLYKYSPKSLAFSILIYSSHVFLYRDLIQIRAGVAYNLVLLSMILVTNKKYIKSLSVYALAIGFHRTSLFSIIIIIINNIYIRTRYVVAVTMAFYLSSFFDFGNYVLSKIPFINNILSENTISTYLSEGGEYAVALSPLNPTTLKLIFVFLCVSYYRDNTPSIKNNNLFYYSYAFSLIFISFFISFNVLASRMASMFSITEVILIPAIVLYSRKLYLITIFLIMYILQFVINYFFKGMDFGGFYYLL